MMEKLWQIIPASWQILAEMAPYLLLGFVVAGLLSVWIAPTWLERHLGGRGMGPVLKASLFGVPLPLCSCGVIPVAASLRHHGASRAATTSFLLSTPQTGVDSILVTHAMLGPLFALYRPVVALLTGLVGGGLVQLLVGREEEAPAPDEVQSAACTDDCCRNDSQQGVLQRALRYGLVTLPRDIAGALLLGVLIAGALSALVPADALQATIGAGVLSILLFMAAGIPLYVCATASVPIAAGFMHMGASPGAALAFLIAGPATNAATFTTVWKVLGPRTAAIYLGTVALSALGCGLLLDWLMPVVTAAAPELGVHVHRSPSLPWLLHLAAVILLGVLSYSYFERRLSARSGDRLTRAAPAPDTDAEVAERLELAVGGMHCSHCQQSVKRAIAECAGVQDVQVDLKRGSATVLGHHLLPESLLAAVRSLGFSAEAKVD